MKKLGVILYIVGASLLSLWCVTMFITPVAPSFPSAKESSKLKIIFAGDVMIHTPQLLKARTNSGYDFNSCFKYVKPYFEAADIAVVNLETTLSDTPPYSGYPLFCSPAEVATALANAGVDVAITANNHALDTGTNGVKSTIDILAQNTILSTGTFKDSIDYKSRNPLIISRNDLKIAILAYTYSTNGIHIPKDIKLNLLDTIQIKSDLSRCKDVDCTIAYLHWGNEYSERISKEQREIAATLHRAGCQVIIGSHPHVVQGAEVSMREVTVYSLGNFISNQRFIGSDGGVMAELDIVKDNHGCQFWVDIIPVWVRKSDYTILPQSAGDTISLTDEDRAAYKLFLKNCSRKF